MSLRSGKLPFLGSKDEFFDHTGQALSLAGNESFFNTHSDA
jgi:hypothetical protein